MNLYDACLSVSNRFTYKADRHGEWKIMKGKKLQGDCEDYALTCLYTYAGSWFEMFSLLLSGQAKIITGTVKDGGRHAWLQVGSQCVDNWSLLPMREASFYEAYGHQKRKAYSTPYIFYRLYRTPVLASTVALTYAVATLLT